MSSLIKPLPKTRSGIAHAFEFVLSLNAGLAKGEQELEKQLQCSILYVILKYVWWL